MTTEKEMLELAAKAMGGPFTNGHLKYFEIHKTYATKKEAAEEVKTRQRNSNYLFTVGYVELKGETE